jgi:DNA-binding response OmpR family regulator
MPDATRPAPSAVTTAPVGDRVLVIAGDATLRGFLAEALQDADYAVETAADAAVGLAAAAAAPPALIMLDLEGAAVAGESFTDRYRRQPGPVAPVVLLSRGSAAETRSAAEALGACGALPLPFELEAMPTLTARAAAAAVRAAAAAAVAQTRTLALALPAAPPEAAAAGPTLKRRRELAAEAQRRHLLERLARDVWDLRPAIAWIGNELQQLAVREETGRLSPEEAARVTVLRRENEALRLQLRACGAEFERLRRRGRGDTAPR